jgi:hypothetical protein
MILMQELLLISAGKIKLIFRLITAMTHSGLIQTQHISIRIILLRYGGVIISAAGFSPH